MKPRGASQAGSSASLAELARRNRELEILNAIAAELNRPVALNQIAQTALAQVAQLLELETGWIFLLDPATGKPYLAAAQNLPHRWETEKDDP